jgi:hypothetical protein
VSALSISIGENGSFPLLTLTLTTITSMQIQNKHASRPLHVNTTMQPPSKITVYVLVSIPTCIFEIKMKKSGIGHQMFKKKSRSCLCSSSTVPEIIDPVFAKTSQNARFLLSENERFGLVFVKTGSINSGTVQYITVVKINVHDPPQAGKSYVSFG